MTSFTLKMKQRKTFAEGEGFSVEDTVEKVANAVLKWKAVLMRSS